jgi:hypothetical protein
MRGPGAQPGDSAEKLAVTVRPPFIERLHDAVPEQAPVQPANMDESFETAVNVTAVPD